MLKKCSYCLIAIIHCSSVSGTRLIASSAWAARETERASLAETREAWAAGTLPFLRSFLPGHPTLQALFPLPALCSSPHPHPITTTPYPPRPQLTSLLISECEDLNELPVSKGTGTWNQLRWLNWWLCHLLKELGAWGRKWGWYLWGQGHLLGLHSLAAENPAHGSSPSWTPAQWASVCRQAQWTPHSTNV